MLSPINTISCAFHDVRCYHWVRNVCMDKCNLIYHINYIFCNYVTVDWYTQLKAVSCTIKSKYTTSRWGFQNAPHVDLSCRHSMYVYVSVVCNRVIKKWYMCFVRYCLQWTLRYIHIHKYVYASIHVCMCM